MRLTHLKIQTAENNSVFTICESISHIQVPFKIYSLEKNTNRKMDVDLSVVGHQSVPKLTVVPSKHYDL